MNQVQYRTCMKPFIAGTGKTREERQINFCVGAKMCTGKARSEEEARKICLAAPPKPPKTPGARRARGKQGCLTQMDELAKCLMEKVDFSAGADLGAVREGLSLCGCGAKPKLSRAQKQEERLAQMSPEQKEALEVLAQMQMDYAPNNSANV
jgi:hypothetical protein